MSTSSLAPALAAPARPAPDPGSATAGPSDRPAPSALVWGRAHGPTPPVEVYELERLVGLSGHDRVRQLRRPLFHVHVIPLAGRLRHSVDFVPVDVVPGQLLHIHPGQLAGLDDVPVRARALVVACPVTEASQRYDWVPGGAPTVASFEPAPWRLLLDAVRQLREELDRFDAGRGHLGAIEALRGLFEARAGQARMTSTPPGPLPAPYLAYRTVMEQQLGEVTQVEHLAKLCGYSVRTLTRACLAATGRSAKELLDERTMLEAQRLLCTTELSVAEIGARLGYGEPTNFARAFKRVTGQSPSQARASTGSGPDRARPAGGQRHARVAPPRPVVHGPVVHGPVVHGPVAHGPVVHGNGPGGHTRHSGAGVL